MSSSGRSRLSALSSALFATLLGLLVSVPIAVGLAYLRVLASTGTLPALSAAEFVVSGQLGGDAVGMALAVSASSLALMLVLGWYSFFDRVDRRWRIPLGSARPRTLVAVSAAMFGLSMILSTSIGLLGYESASLDEMRLVFDSAGPWGRLALVPVIGWMAGVCEELFFRGLILERLRRTWSDPVAIAVSSVLFGIMHLDPVHALAAAGMGALLGIVAVRERTIVPSMVAHVVNNTIVTLAPGLESDENRWALLIAGVALLGVGAYGLARLEPSGT
ncbi:MAG: CPBP family intramembrane metalloprotease [Deltaproteobacteria bacterium]|nr:CPBP family intramembrane metalloprotease [Deltaproteobacteria bacterium]